MIQRNTYFNIAQEILHNKCNKNIRVIPSAISAQDSRHEVNVVTGFLRFMEPDYIIQFSGRNDIYNIGYLNTDLLNYDPFNFASNVGQKQRIQVISMDNQPNVKDFKNMTQYTLALREYNKSLMKNIDEIMQETNGNIGTINAVAKQLKVTHIYLLQSDTLNTQKKLLPSEKKLRTLWLKYYGIEKYSKSVRQSQIKTLPQLSTKYGFAWYDMDDVVAKSSHACFTDVCHFGDYCQKEIGEYIANTVLLEDLKSKGLCNK